MLIKINRQDCLNTYPNFPLRSYDDKKDEEEFFYPKVFKSYTMTLHSKSFKGHIKQLGLELLQLTQELAYDHLIFLGDKELTWLNQFNDYKPAKEAQQFLVDNKIGKRFNGALQVNSSELVTFVIHLSWLTRCNASLPYFHFTDHGQNMIGHICQYGNLHLDILNEVTAHVIHEFIDQSNLIEIEENNCFNQFGKTSAIAGRSIIPYK